MILKLHFSYDINHTIININMNNTSLFLKCSLAVILLFWDTVGCIEPFVLRNSKCMRSLALF